MLIVSKAPEKTKTGEIVTLAQAKKQLNIESDFTDDDTHIGELINVAVEMVEDDINSDILDTENILQITTSFSKKIQVMQSPMRVFTKLEKYYNNEWSEIDSDIYTVEAFYHYFLIEFSQSFNCDKLKFTFNTGYTASTYPKKLRHAVLLRCTDLYDNERQGYNLANIQPNKAYQHCISKHVRKYW